MITQKEFDENLSKMEFSQPSFDEIIAYSESGEDDKNALEYEKAYTKLLDQVKDKPHEEQVEFLISHMNELREIVSLFSSARDMYMFTDCEIGNRILANLLIYRYQNNISILDDEYCEKTEDYIKEIRYEIYSKIGKEEAEAEAKFEREHPEEAEEIHKQRILENKKWANNIKEINKDFLKKYSVDDLLYGDFIKKM